MKLVPLFDLATQRSQRSFVGPLATGESFAILQGEGIVTGDRLRGRLTRVNHPRFRQDGIHETNVIGVITTDDDETVYLEMHGYTIPREGQPYRNIVASMTFRTASESLNWINAVFAVVEGRYEPEKDVRYHVYECQPDATY